MIGTAWSMLLSRLPASVDLAALAHEYQALRRRRGVPDAETLLRLALSYGACGLSLRGTAAWAEMASLASLSDVAVLNRLRGSAPWLSAIMGAILSARVPGPAGAAAGFRLRLIDATTLSAPGSGGADWRVHVAYDLAAQQTTSVVLSDSGGESLRRFDWASGDLAVADRGYAKALDLAAVVAAGADFIVRIGWNALRLRTRDGAPFDLCAALDGVPELGCAAIDLGVLDRAGTTPQPARLVILRKSDADAEASRRTARRKSRRQGKTVQPNTLKAAGYVILLTSLDGARAAADDILALYRLRWQIELVFKRLKSLLDLGALPAKDPDLARSWIYAKLIVALLLEDVTRDALDSPPWAGRIPAAHDLALAPATRAA